jgi:hypothetical protein
MRVFIVLFAALFFLHAFTACNSSAPPATFCDTACLKDTIKFTESSHPLQPYVYISPSDCGPGQVILSHGAMDMNRKISFSDLAGTGVRLNKNNVSAFIKDTSYVWLTFNDCLTGRGYIIKIPFNKTDKIRRKATAFTSFDPKYSIAPGLVAYTDKGNLFVEDMTTGKTAMMTFGKELDIDFEAMHEHIDSVNVTPTHVYAKVKIGEDWKELQQNVELLESAEVK